jgi:hypothetical protein
MHTKEKKSCCYIPMGRSNEHINGDAPIRVYRWARRKSTALSPLPQCLSPPHWRRRLLPLSSLSTTKLCLSASLSAPHRTVMALESFAPGRARGISLSTSQSQEAAACRTGAAECVCFPVARGLPAIPLSLDRRDRAVTTLYSTVCIMHGDILRFVSESISTPKNEREICSSTPVIFLHLLKHRSIVFLLDIIIFL